MLFATRYSVLNTQYAPAVKGKSKRLSTTTDKDNVQCTQYNSIQWMKYLDHNKCVSFFDFDFTSSTVALSSSSSFNDSALNFNYLYNVYQVK